MTVKVVGGVALLLAAAAWQFLAVPRLLQRIPPGWRYDMSYVGIQTNALPNADTLPTRDVLSQYQRAIRVIESSGRPDSVTVEDSYRLTEIGTGKLQYDFVVTYVVDPRTGALVHHPGEIFLFPRHVQKRTYLLRASYLKGLPMRFLREEEVEGITTYVFGHNGRGEYTEFYEGVVDGRRVEIPDGEEVRCANDQFRYRTWVEPVTGVVVKAEESCLSGDFAYDRATGRRLHAVDRFFGTTAGADVTALVNRARIGRLRVMLLDQAIPLLLLAGGAVLLLLDAISRRRGAA